MLKIHKQKGKLLINVLGISMLVVFCLGLTLGISLWETSMNTRSLLSYGDGLPAEMVPSEDEHHSSAAAASPAELATVGHGTQLSSNPVGVSLKEIQSFVDGAYEFLGDEGVDQMDSEFVFVPPPSLNIDQVKWIQVKPKLNKLAKLATIIRQSRMYIIPLATWDPRSAVLVTLLDQVCKKYDGVQASIVEQMQPGILTDENGEELAELNEFLAKVKENVAYASDEKIFGPSIMKCYRKTKTACKWIWRSIPSWSRQSATKGTDEETGWTLITTDEKGAFAETDVGHIREAQQVEPESEPIAQGSLDSERAAETAGTAVEGSELEEMD